jgi:pimeloyl-ACP methyl ester carboxylesterase
VHGLDIYYEVYGAGEPLVLLHGALSTIRTSFGKVLPGLAKGRQVIAVELQGHGHTADLDRPLSYEQMADDTAALVRQLGVERADLFGYSMGGGVVLEMALRHPNLVRKLVVASAPFARDGFHPGVLDGIDDMSLDDLTDTPFHHAYAATAPNPGHWPTLVAKVQRFDAEFAGWPAEAVKSISAPTLLVLGDADIVRPEHAVEMFRLFGGGVAGDLAPLSAAQLAVLPGTTHLGLVDRDAWLISMIEAFLDAPLK